MKEKRDLRQSLAAKGAAILLLFVFSAGAVMGTLAVTLVSCGYGAANEFQNDILCDGTLNSAMDYALDYVMSSSDGSRSYRAYLARTYMERAGGFSALVYEGAPAAGKLLGSWSEIPGQGEILCQRAKTVDISDETGNPTGNYYTVVGYVSVNLPHGSDFAVRYSLYNTLHDMPYGGAVVLTVLLYICALVMFVFLLCAAGHKAGTDQICFNWQDRVPLDLYLCLAVALFCIALLPALVSADGGMPVALEIAAWCLSFTGAGFVLLAALLSMATRLKKGKWWRNTICWRLVRWCKKLWKRCWRAVVALVHILPMTWRVILGALGVLGAQSVLTVCVFAFYDGFFFLLVMIAIDVVLAVGAAWLTIQLQKVRDMGSALAAGDLEAHLDTEKMYFDVKRHAEDLNAIGVGMNKAVEQRLKSERLKTELITNVSHDIKTPLTSIVNYVDLLQKEDLPPAAREYVMVLDRQSHRLKKLTEDLVEASKASTGNMTVSLEPIVVNEIIHQAVGDYDEKLAAGKLEVIVNTYEGNLMALADGRLLWRVLDNLLSNVCKYAMAGTRVYVDLAARDGKVVLSVKNISRDPLNVSADELMERFVRGDASRHTEGSGLGLNIARSLMDLMGGSFGLYVDGDLFKAELTLRA